MLTEQKKHSIRSAIKLIQTMDEAFNELDKSLKVADSAVFNSAWLVVDALIGELDSGEWISWFVFDNEYGRSGLKAGYGGNLKPIKNVDDLIDLIERECADAN